MSTLRVRARLSALAVEVEFVDAPKAAHTFAAVWSSSSTCSFTPCTRVVAVRVERSGPDFAILFDGETPVRADDERTVCPIIERRVYDIFLEVEQAARRAVLHASGLVRGDTTFVFAGDSGAGKSSLARAALEAGCQYFSDEHLVTDGWHIWGVPRAVHLDLEPAHRLPSPWHRGADRESYVFPGGDGQLLRLPFVPVAASQIADGPRRVDRAVLVALRHTDTNTVEALRAGERLSLVERANFVRSSALADVALIPRAFALTWREPAQAFSLLVEAVAG